MILKRYIAGILSILIIFSNISFASFAKAQDPEVYLNGKKAAFKNTPYLDDGIWMMPFKETMDGLGFPVSYDKSKGIYVTYVGPWEASVVPDSEEERFDLVDIELERATKGTENDVYVQLDYFSKIYNSTVSALNNNIRINLSYKENTDDESLTFDKYVESLPKPELLLNMDDILSRNVKDKQKEIKPVDLEGEPFDKALQFESFVKLNAYWEVGTAWPINKDIMRDDVIVMTFWARCIQSYDESMEASIDVVLEHNTTWDKQFECTDTVGQEWKKFRAAFKSRVDLPGKGSFSIRGGHYKQTFQIADMQIYNYARNYTGDVFPVSGVGYYEEEVSIYKENDYTYYGREEGALWREEALKRIEKHRVRDINVNVVDEKGNPIQGAKVNADMTRNEFHFGTMVQPKAQWNSIELGPVHDEIVLKHFNSVSDGNHFKPTVPNSDFGEGEGNNFEAARNMNFVTENNLYTRSHSFTVAGNGLLGNDGVVGQTREAALINAGDRASELYTYWADVFDEVDVFTEILRQKETLDRERFASFVQIVKDIAPDTLTFWNEASMDGIESDWRRVYNCKELLDELQGFGMPLDGMAFESHYRYAIYPQMSYNQMDYMLQTVDYGTMTEYDLKYRNYTCSNLEFEKISADFLRDALIISYSHPKMVGFQMWGFADQNHWRGWGPLYDDKMLPRELAVANWEKYVNGEWKTRTSAETDENGQARMRGHRGEYEITIEIDGMIAKTTLKVTKDGVNTVNAVYKDNQIITETSEAVVLDKDVVKNPYVSPFEMEYNATTARHEWRKLYASTVESVVGANGEELSTLKGNNQDITLFNETDLAATYYDENTLMGNLKNKLNKGFLRFRMDKTQNGDNGYVVEGRCDGGEWKQIYAGGNICSKPIPFNFPVDEIKVTVSAGAVRPVFGIVRAYETDIFKENCYFVKKGEYVTAKLTDIIDNGYVLIGMPNDTEYKSMCQIEGRAENGEWQVIGRYDKNDIYINFDFPVDEVRITSVGEKPVKINNIHVAQKRWVCLYSLIDND